MAARKSSAAAKPEQRGLVLTRVFDAPRRLVFKAWTEREHLMQWWGQPKGATMPYCKVDLREGGTLHFRVNLPDGNAIWGKGVYREIVEPKRLVFTDYFSDEHGNIVEPPPGHPKESVITATFTERDGKTTVTVEHAGLERASKENQKAYQQGWGESLDRLAEDLRRARLDVRLATQDEPLVVERTFDAPVALVWKALTDKEDIRQWSFDIREFAPVVGFEFQFYGGDEGAKYSHRCRVTEAIPNKRLAYTWRYEGYAGDSLVTFELFAQGSNTRVRLTHAGLETFPKLPAFAKANFVAGWTEIVGTSLKDFVEGRHAGEMILTRVFDAPRELVFKVWSDPAHVRRWWGPKGFTLPGCEMDFRPGGAYRFVMRGPGGQDYPFQGVYREIVVPERIVFTAILDNLPGHELVTTVTFAEEGGKTKLTVRQTTPPGEAGRGQNQGWSESLDRLADLITEEMKHGRRK